MIYLRGQLVAALKAYKEKSVVGLANVVDSQGNYRIFEGAVYSSSPEITHVAYNFGYAGFERLDLEELPLFPLRFMNGLPARNLNRRMRQFRREMQDFNP